MTTWIAGFVPALALGLVAAGPVRAQTAPAPVAEFYAGKQLNIVVGLAAGGTVDTFVRMLLPYLKKHIPGSPTVIAQNMAGAGGMLATNYIGERATPDGLTVSYGPWDPLAQALGEKTLRVRYETLRYYGGFADTRVLYARTDIVPGGMKRPADIAKAPYVAVGAQNATDLSGLLSAVALDLLGVKNKFVMGYRGGTEVFLAVQRGEVQMHNTSIGTFRTRNAEFIKSGQGIAICYLAGIDAEGKFDKSPHLPDLLALPELYREINGKLPSGVEWETMGWLSKMFSDMAYIGLAPPKMPEPALAALRKGFQAAMADPEFIALSIKSNGVPYEPVLPEHATAVFASLASVKPEVLATAKRWLDGFGK
jgi:tripartite-type tricarboxylate transporter receptor subunit TctC